MDKCRLLFMDDVKINYATKSTMSTEAIVHTGREPATRRASRVETKLLEYCLNLSYTLGATAM